MLKQWEYLVSTNYVLDIVPNTTNRSIRAILISQAIQDAPGWAAYVKNDRLFWRDNVKIKVYATERQLSNSQDSETEIFYIVEVTLNT